MHVEWDDADGSLLAKYLEWIDHHVDGGAESEFEFHELERALRDTGGAAGKVHGDDGRGADGDGGVYGAVESVFRDGDRERGAGDHFDADDRNGNKLREPGAAQCMRDEFHVRHAGDVDGDGGDGILVLELDGGTMRRHGESMCIHGEQHQPDERDGGVHDK